MVPSSGGGGGATAQYIPWKPRVTNEGTIEAPEYKARFNMGTWQESVRRAQAQQARGEDV